jgi:dipeptidase E
MPIIEPHSFDALQFFPFQINPHYINEVKENHNGETRDQRLEEFLKVNLGMSIIGLPEGTALVLNGEKLVLAGQQPATLFNTSKTSNEMNREEITPGQDISYLL